MTAVALYDKPQVLRLPEMYSKHLSFKTSGVDGRDCEEVLMLIQQVKIAPPLITHRFPFRKLKRLIVSLKTAWTA